MEKQLLAEIQNLYNPIKESITERLREFEIVGKTGTEEELFAELAFCLLTPQSKALYCWEAVECMADKKLWGCRNPEMLAAELNKVRFKNTKARRILEARERFGPDAKMTIRGILNSFRNPFRVREWLVNNIAGLGYKEASHFLRNIGYGKNLAILDRHILKNLAALDVISEVPKALTLKKYLEIEHKMKLFAKQIKIPLDHLDLILWYKEAGCLFK
ncbi:N-glycosylase/DNA lyase [bacterium]|nr:N-glycosylase/DNA lyase [bacterium]